MFNINHLVDDYVYKKLYVETFKGNYMSKKEKLKSFLKVYKYVIYDIATIIIAYYLTIWVFKGMGGDISFKL